MDNTRGCLRILGDVVLYFVLYSLIPVSNSGLRYLIAFVVVGIIEAVRSTPNRPRLSRGSLTLIVIVAVLIVLGVGSVIVQQQQYESAFQQAVSDLNAGDFPNAISGFNRAIELRPDDAGSYINLGVAHLRQGDTDTSITYFATAIGLDSNNALAYNNRGVAYFNKGDYEHAIADLQRALQLDPNLAEADRQLGTIYYLRGEHLEALAALKEYARIAGDKADLQIVVTIAQLEAELGSPDAMGEAHLGSNPAKMVSGHRQVWTYAGKASEMLSLSAIVDYTGGLNFLGPFLTIRSPDGSTLAANTSAVFCDSSALIKDLKLPTDGIYTIELRDKDNKYDGSFSLVVFSVF